MDEDKIIIELVLSWMEGVENIPSRVAFGHFTKSLEHTLEAVLINNEVWKRLRENR